MNDSAREMVELLADAQSARHCKLTWPAYYLNRAYYKEKVACSAELIATATCSHLR